MQVLLKPIQELAEFDELKKILQKEGRSAALTGCVDSQKLHMMCGFSDGFQTKVIATYSDLKAKEIYEEYKFYELL